MTKQAIHTDQAPQPGGAYSQGVVSGGFLFTSGFGPHDPRTGEVAASVGAQTAQVLRNIQAVLAERGLTLHDVVRTTVYLHHLKHDFTEFNAVYSEFFSDPMPARTTVGSELMDILVAIDVVAKLRE
ncbi:reactive intermediate/imine deaminase [Nocardiopsis gilva YIM 90087]|uniref:Reactive intermediate/imine deaminase n=1 Tax=Nocardiopsis gilva YIM 90087 TaxID=1235441 RepID=A0A223S1S9_9ACTN|nr:Rid family detoxifying hydrolase [Nocardiopsis gilva]ASU82080.1 reactive intermediate/imine deaminase [Nocardiopsis gilva YIM 90087]